MGAPSRALIRNMVKARVLSELVDIVRCARHDPAGKLGLQLGQPRLLRRGALRTAGELDELLADDAVHDDEQPIAVAVGEAEYEPLASRSERRHTETGIDAVPA